MTKVKVRTNRHRDIHPDDTQARIDLAVQLHDIRRATGVPLSIIKKSMEVLSREQSSDWKFQSLEFWAGYFNFAFQLTLEGFDQVEGFDPEVKGEGAEFIRDFHQKVIDLRKALGLTGAEMSRRLGQTNSYLIWEYREPVDIQLSTAQRVVRALGGRLKISLTHKFNAGINKRIGTRDGA